MSDDHVPALDEVEPWPQISATPGLPGWLAERSLSIACTSYQTGQLFMIGAKPDGGINVDQHSFNHAMGLCFDRGRLWLGTHTQVWRLENILSEDEVFSSIFDRVFVPRVGYSTGRIDIHEIGVVGNQPVFVNTEFSCLAILDDTHSFQPVWKPRFISDLQGQDRCHLNGMCIADGAVKYVTAAGRSDDPHGWRKKRANGGIVIDVEADQVIAEKLSMPHSPRLHEGRLYVLDSGRGWLVEVDRRDGTRREVAFVNGFLRGLAFYGRYAVMGSSMPRDKTFNGLPLDASLKKRKLEPWCGIFIVDLSSGEIVEWLRFETKIVETFDLALLPEVRCPMSIGVLAPEFANRLSFRPIEAQAGGPAAADFRALHHVLAPPSENAREAPGSQAP